MLIEGLKTGQPLARYELVAYEGAYAIRDGSGYVKHSDGSVWAGSRTTAGRYMIKLMQS